MSEANGADLAEQLQAADPADPTVLPTRPEASLAEASEGDALEQGAEVTPDDDVYPHVAEQEADAE